MTKLQRRKFLYVATGAASFAGLAGAAYPLIDQMNPSADVLSKSIATNTVDLTQIPVGKNLILKILDSPVVIRHRTPAEIIATRSEKHKVSLNYGWRQWRELKLDTLNENRAIKGHPAFVALLPICTFHGCFVIYETESFNGWFCPCCGSHFDSLGRARYGPADRDLTIPKHFSNGKDAITISIRKHYFSG